MDTSFLKALPTCLCAYMLAPPSFAQGLQLVADSDNASTIQTLSIDRSNLTFDPMLTAKGQAVCVWRANITNNPQGAAFTILRSTLTGQNADKLASAISLSVEDGAGALSFVPNSKFAAGAALTDISTVHDNLGSVQGSGQCRFRLRLTLNSGPRSGAGTLGGTLMIIGALNP